jgi:hypothetical protein
MWIALSSNRKTILGKDENLQKLHSQFGEEAVYVIEQDSGKYYCPIVL